MGTTAQNLTGAFASIETHLVKLFERDPETRAWKEKVENDNAALRQQWQDLARRVEALEKQQPPAA
ncbi:MAG: hypothetical protein HY319_10540 [Armatimonadetes bacterium]|nr:hypothetical protein [Armatimonadota bacterium]